MFRGGVYSRIKEKSFYVNATLVLLILRRAFVDCWYSIFCRRSSKKFVNLTFNGKPTFWSCVTNILSGHERDRYNSLQNVKTNLGKGRSWLRSALNERSLERYLNTLICNEELLNLYYEPCAFLCDQEKSYILSTAAGGI